MSLRKNQYRKMRLVCIIIMSAANSAAKKRRAPPSTEPIRPQVSNMPGKAQPSNGSSTGLTLPQVIALIDTRLVRLETVTKTIMDSSNSETTDKSMDAISPEIMEEFNTRFEIIAEEVANIKNIVLNLQSYTMNVNNMLLQERKSEGKSIVQYMGGVSSDEVDVEVDMEEEDVQDVIVEEEVVLGEVAPQWTKA